MTSPIPYTPGVVVHEIPAQNKPIEGVATSIVGFVGRAPGGPVGIPMQITSWTQFARIFGDPADVAVKPPLHVRGPFMEGAYLAHAVYGFFLNGGGECWVVRMANERGRNVPQISVFDSQGEAGQEAYRVVPLSGTTDIKVSVTADKPADPDRPETTAVVPLVSTAAGGHPTYTVTVTGKGADGAEVKEPPEGASWTGLTVAPGARNLASVINSSSQLVRVVDTGAVLPAPSRELTVIADAEPAAVARTTPTVTSLTGPDSPIVRLASAHGVTTVCVPDAMSIELDDAGLPDPEGIKEVHTAIAGFCEENNCMAIFDPLPQMDSPQEVRTWSTASVPPSKFTTLYWPWVRVSNPLGGDPLAVPPCGHVAGVWARTDGERGVFKAPANEEVRGAVDLAVHIGDNDQSEMNHEGINCIRSFPGRGIRVWGARTLSGGVEPEWVYLNVRRLFNYLSASILQGTQWAVFEPNDETLWVSLRASVSNFLTTVWRSGALFGASPSEAFFVKCDAETNPPEERDLGKVNIVVGVAPVKPAEFVIFQLSQYQPTAG